MCAIPDDGWRFESDPALRTITYSYRAVEIIWAVSLYAWTINELMATNPGASEISFSGDDEIREIPSLLEWAIKNQSGKVNEPWPANAPRPHPSGLVNRENPTRIDVATEITLCACAWILHHELAHVDLNHPLVDPYSIAHEIEADRAATDWILSAARTNAEVTKRGVGLAVALIVLSAMELRFPLESWAKREHPPIAERLHKALAHERFGGYHVVHQIAAPTLLPFLRVAGITVPTGPYETWQDALADYCLALARGVRQ